MIASVRTLTGRQLRDEYVARYGSPDELRRLARRRPKGPHIEALVWIETCEENPEFLDREVQHRVVHELEAEELDGLTGTRVRLWTLIEKAGETDLKGLREATDRDHKSISRDVNFLEAIGLVESRREGRHRIVRSLADRVEITV